MTSSAPSNDMRNPLIAAPSPASAPGAGLPDFEKLGANAARFLEQSGKALNAYLRPFESGDAVRNDSRDTMVAAMGAIGKVAEHWMGDPARMAEAQAAIATPFLQLWAQTYRRLQGETVEPLIPLAKGDKRFAAPDWAALPLFDFLRQAHALGANLADALVDGAAGVDPAIRAKARFYLRQISSASSPANFLATNPELMRATFESSGENLVRGAALLAEDMERGGGTLRLRQTDVSAFEIGRNVAVSPGKVVFRNALFELIQYAPTTPQVSKRPLLIMPPWINKFYILDLNKEKSFVGWAVSQGVTVFLISWVNPDASLRDKRFEDYMHEGAVRRPRRDRAGHGRARRQRHRLLHRRHAARVGPGLHGGARRHPHQERDLLDRPGRFQRRRRARCLRRRRSVDGARQADGRDRLSRRRADGDGV